MANSTKKLSGVVIRIIRNRCVKWSTTKLLQQRFRVIVMVFNEADPSYIHQIPMYGDTWNSSQGLLSITFLPYQLQEFAAALPEKSRLPQTHDDNLEIQFRSTFEYGLANLCFCLSRNTLCTLFIHLLWNYEFCYSNFAIYWNH